MPNCRTKSCPILELSHANHNLTTWERLWFHRIMNKETSMSHVKNIKVIDIWSIIFKASDPPSRNMEGTTTSVGPFNENIWSQHTFWIKTIISKPCYKVCSQNPQKKASVVEKWSRDHTAFELGRGTWCKRSLSFSLSLSLSLSPSALLQQQHVWSPGQASFSHCVQLFSDLVISFACPTIIYTYILLQFRHIGSKLIYLSKNLLRAFGFKYLFTKIYQIYGRKELLH